MEQKIRVLAKKVFGTDGESIGIVTASSRNHVGHRVITHLMDENHPEKTICGRNLNGWIIKREYGGVNQFVNCKRCINIYQKHGLQPSKIPKK